MELNDDSTNCLDQELVFIISLECNHLPNEYQQNKQSENMRRRFILHSPRISKVEIVVFIIFFLQYYHTTPKVAHLLPVVLISILFTEICNLIYDSAGENLNSILRRSITEIVNSLTSFA